MYDRYDRVQSIKTMSTAFYVESKDGKKRYSYRLLSI